MKLIANNFTGVLTNGNRYKITVNKTFVREVFEYRIDVNVHEYIYDGWFLDASLSVTQWYKNENKYKSCLRYCLIELESKLGIQLLKGELIAVA